MPAVELHGNLAQNARNRNLSAFSDGSAQTLVATDIAARGIHVDDVALVIHADPPVEHKAYLHRSGRTARAGAQGTVITLMTDDQQGDVRDLTRKAGIKPTTTKARPGDPLLAQLAPGERTFSAAPPVVAEAAADNDQPSRGRATAAGRGRPARSRPPAPGVSGTGRAARRGQGRPSSGGTGRPRRGGTGSTPIRTGQTRSASGRSAGPSARPAAAPRSAAAFSAGTRAGRRSAADPPSTPTAAAPPRSGVVVGNQAGAL